MDRLIFPYDLYPTLQRRPTAEAYTLRARYEDQHREPKVYDVVDVKRRLSYGETLNHGVYHVVVTDGSSNGQSVDMVCKIAYQRHDVTRLRAEAITYVQELRHLYGRQVPICYGFFIGQTGDGLTAILLLEYCGPLLQVPLWKQPVDFRYVWHGV